MKTLKETKKITLATLKSFAKRNSNNLYVNEKSSFNGMTDCVETVNSGWKKTKIIENKGYYKTGIEGIYTVGSSRDSFNLYEDENYIGIEVYNSCGASILAIKKQTTMKTYNLETPEIKAQQICKEAILEAGQDLLRLYGILEEKGIIESFEYLLETYNRGYMLKIKSKFDWRKMDEMVTKKLQNFIFSFHSISIQPKSFFNSDFEESCAQIEMELVRTEKNQLQFDKRTIKNDDDFDGCKLYFKNITYLRVNELMKEL